MEGIPTAHATPSGWYPDPEGRGLRYWSGTAWTEHLAPTGAESPKRVARTGDWVGGVLLGLLMPLIGLIAGLVYVTKDDDRRTVGIVTCAVSVAMFVLWMALAAGSGSGGSGY